MELFPLLILSPPWLMRYCCPRPPSTVTSDLPPRDAPKRRVAPPGPIALPPLEKNMMQTSPGSKESSSGTRTINYALLLQQRPSIYLLSRLHEARASGRKSSHHSTTCYRYLKLHNGVVEGHIHVEQQAARERQRPTHTQVRHKEDSERPCRSMRDRNSIAQKC